MAEPHPIAGAPAAAPAVAGADASSDEGSSFVEGLLREVRAGGYRPGAWWRFFARSWQRSRTTARAHPRLVRDWAWTSGGIAGATLAALALEWRAGHTTRAGRAMPWVGLGLAAHAADVYAHLGMNATTRGGAVYETLAAGTRLTMVRQAVAAWLWGHLLAGARLTRPALMAALALASATDLADGAIARRTHHTTHLGAYLDGMADLSVSLALALALRRRRLIARWFLAALAGRWLVPFGGALYQYFARARPVPLRASRWGKVAGAAQHVALALAVMPNGGHARLARARRWGQAIAAASLVAAPLAHLRAIRPREP
ncbi:MAG TPA: CDP-alcohol phosphatidyltransferase family protein [Ktedonobacterales bacterium]|nr:CDP-alcohol phosphatidyltransferase family protein [Ktedonobacterales bacterium]